MAVPAGTVTGKLIPLIEYPGPLQDALETEILELPAVRVPVMFLLLPTATLPKARVAGAATKLPSGAATGAACVPVPVKVWVAGEFAALLTKVTLPGELPGACGVKVTL